MLIFRVPSLKRSTRSRPFGRGISATADVEGFCGDCTDCFRVALCTLYLARSRMGALLLKGVFPLCILAGSVKRTIKELWVAVRLCSTMLFMVVQVCVDM